MDLLKERIIADGRVLGTDILKVDGFLNHQIDVELIQEIGREIHRLYKDCGVNKILTIEASGIAIACFTAQFFHVPVLFAKKNRSANIPNDVYSVRVSSFTHKKSYDVIVSKRYIGPEDRILIIDDFLAEGNALEGLIRLIQDAGAEVVGAAIAIEKAFQPGGERIRQKGVRVESLARIASMSETEGIRFLP